MKNEIVLVAGGTGLIGRVLVKNLRDKGHEVRLLSRQQSNLPEKIYNWDPYKGVIDNDALENVSVIINLVGAGIADKRWTASRKKVLLDSRVIPARFLYEKCKKSSSLKHYISASGINAYGYEEPKKTYKESDPFGKDFLSQIVEQWEESADIFADFGMVTKIRTAVVLSNDGGALPRIAKPVKMGVGAPLGSGKQSMPWIAIQDLVRLFAFVIQEKIEGPINAVAKNDSNKTVTHAIAKTLNKKVWLPNVPSFVMSLLLGEMATMLLNGVKASNEKIVTAGFEFRHNDIEEALRHIYFSKS